MRLLPVTAELKNAQSQQSSMLQKPNVKMNSVTFEKHLNLQKEVLTTLKTTKGIGLYEKPSFCTYQSVLDTDLAKYSLVETNKKILGIPFHSFKIEKTMGESNTGGTSERSQSLTVFGFNMLKRKFREAAIPKILRKNGFKQRNVESFLSDINQNIEKGNVKRWNDCGDNYYGDLTMNLSLLLKTRPHKIVTLSYTPTKDIYELAIDSDKIILKKDSEINLSKDIYKKIMENPNNQRKLVRVKFSEK